MLKISTQSHLDVHVKYEGYPESNFRFHVEHEVVGAARRGCTAV
jgi:hypothetical protein